VLLPVELVVRGSAAAPSIAGSSVAAALL
jgi:hypothetical protein